MLGQLELAVTCEPNAPSVVATGDCVFTLNGVVDSLDTDCVWSLFIPVTVDVIDVLCSIKVVDIS